MLNQTEVNAFETKENSHWDYGLKVLICALLEMLYRDLVGYVNNPIKKEVEFRKYNYNTKYLLDFWENDAFFFFAYLYGESKARKIIEKISWQIEKAKKIYQSVINYTIYPAFNVKFGENYIKRTDISQKEEAKVVED